MALRGLPETLLSESTLFLFGRIMEDIRLRGNRDHLYRIRTDPLSRLSPHHFTEEQLEEQEQGVIARIYSFAYHNELIDLAKPALFVLGNNGADLGDEDDDEDEKEKEKKDPAKEKQRLYRLSLKAGVTGLGSQVSKFASDMRVWAVDRDDYTVRLDVMTGPFDRILLQYEMGEDLFQGFAPRGGAELGRPSPIGGGGFRGGRGRGRRWRADDE